MDIEQLTARLAECRERLCSPSPSDKPERWAEWEDEHSKCLRLEFEIALLKAEEAAERLDWPVRWDIGSPMPHVISGNGRTFLTYYVGKFDAGSPTSNAVKVIDSADDRYDPVALVEFLGCYDLRFGGPNDEVQGGHPLYGSGLDFYQAHIVHNSKWRVSVEKIIQVHDRYHPAGWAGLKHYLLLFHEELFECLARDYVIEVYWRGGGGVVDIAVDRMLGYEG